jgi:hypothetical protein
MPIIRVNKTFPPEQQTWEPMDPGLRNRWCQTLIEFPPIFLGATMMLMAQGEARANGFHDSGDWISLGKEFDAAGFTPEEFADLMRAINSDPRSNPWHTADGSYVSNRLVTLSSARGGRRMIRLRASDWVNYLARVRAGEKPQAVVDEMLAPHWGKQAEVICE